MWSTATCLLAAATAVAPTPEAQAPVEVFVVYRSQHLPDATQARLTSALARSVPIAKWREEVLAPGESLETALDRVYDYYRGRKRGAMPQTTAALLNLVRAANPDYREDITAVRSIRLPSIPIRAHEMYDFADTLRVFDASARGYEILSPSKPSTTSGHGLLTVASVTGDRADDDVAANDPRQDGTVTSVATTLTRELLEASRDWRQLIVLPKTSQAGFTRVELLQPAAVPCGGLDAWWASPYRALAEDRIASLRQPGFAFGDRPDLVLVDIDFTGNAHGAKVAGVVQYTLETLGLAGAFAPHVKTLDLAIKDDTSAKAAHQLVDEYAKATRLKSTALSVFLGPTHAWIDAEKDRDGGPPLEVPVVLVQAALWKAMNNSPFINLSFRFEDPASSLVRPIVRADRDLFVTVAAGNDPSAVSPLWAPQDAATSMPGFVNVTYGDSDGTVLGAYTNRDNLRLVSVLAPGCGFRSGAVKPTDYGSSLAAPFVAVAGWVRHALGKSALKGMRSELLRSARLLPKGVPDLIDSGAFDLWRFLSDVGPHVTTTATPGQMIPLSNPVFEFTGTCRLAGGGPHQFTPRAGQSSDFVVYRDSGAVQLVMRTVTTGNATERPRVDNCSVTSLQLTASAPFQPVTNLDDFLYMYAYVSL